MRLFGLGRSRGYAAKMAARLGTPLSEVKEEWRPDTEPWAAALDNVRGKDVFVVSSLCSGDRSVSDNTMQLLLFVDALKRASAGRVTAVTPYLSFMRQDRKDGPREPVSIQALAKFFEAAGTDRVLLMDAHNVGAIQCSFRIPVDILEANNLLADRVCEKIVRSQWRKPVVLSPDAGGVKRAKKFQESLEARLGERVDFAHGDKARGPGGVTVNQIIGDVADKQVVILDDMIATGGTIRSLADAVRKRAGHVWGVVATHGLFNEGSAANLAGLPNVVVADTVHSDGPGCERVSTDAMFAEAVRRIHSDDGSISELLKDTHANHL